MTEIELVFRFLFTMALVGGWFFIPYMVYLMWK